MENNDYYEPTIKTIRNDDNGISREKKKHIFIIV